jgi:hypothetical protein
MKGTPNRGPGIRYRSAAFEIPESTLVRLKGKDRSMEVSTGPGCCRRPIPASYNRKSGARTNRRAGFDKLVASRMVAQS